MFGALTSLTGGGGLSGSSSATSSTGNTTLGGFTFSPKSSAIPPVAWLALAALAVLLIVRR